LAGKTIKSTPIKFEDALSRLEKIVSELEGGSLELDDILTHFEEGITLSQICEDRLKKIESKIQILLKKAEPEPINEPVIEGNGQNKKGKKKIEDQYTLSLFEAQEKTTE
jgi:exodeoxyribonuclease VII small subunit